MFFRILQQERLHPVPAPVGLHHLKYVADGGRAGDTGDYYYYHYCQARVPDLIDLTD